VKVREDWARVEKANTILSDERLRSKYDIQRVLVKGMVGYEIALEKQKILRDRK
jgi:hypothetical protein